MKYLLFLLPVLAFFNGISLSLSGLNIRLDQLLTVIILGIVVANFLILKKKVYIDKAGIFLVGLWMVSLFSSFFNAPDRKYSLVQTVNFITVSSCYFILPNLITNFKKLTNFINLYLSTAILITVIGTVLFLFSISTGVVIYGINTTQNESDAFGLFLTMREPNVFGSFMLVIFLLAFSLYLSNSTFPGWGRKEILILLVVSLIAVILSFTRGVWLGAMVAIASFFLRSFKDFYKNIGKIVLAVAVIFSVTYFLANVLNIGFIAYKLNNFFQAESGTGLGRLLVWNMAIDNWMNTGHYFVGNGTYSFASFFNSHEYDNMSNIWIGNMLITLLHDSGIVGLSCFLIFYIFLFVYTVKPSVDNIIWVNYINIGFRMGLIGIFIAFFFTVALSYTYPWILFGLISTLRRLNQAKYAQPVLNLHG